MTDYREILRLRGLQYSQRAIARSVRCSRNTVEKVLAASAQLHLAWPLFDDVTNADLERFLFPDKHKASSQYAEPDYPYSHRELARSGVTLTLLWEEYCAKCHETSQKQRLEAACGKALVYSTAPALRTIASILKNGLDKPDKAESQLPQSKANSYGITRGAAYFRKGGDRGC